MGLTDIQIIAGIVTLFVFLGVLLPFIEAEFDEPETSYSSDLVTDDIDEGHLSSISAWRIITSIFKMFFWYAGVFPWWLDMGFVILRLILVVTIARNIWIGGGG